MSELPSNETFITVTRADAEARGVQTFGVTSRRKRNVARRILLKSQQRLLWLWPQYFPKHDIVTGRLKTESSEPDAGGPARAREDLRGLKDQPGDYWSDPGWRNAARQYHAARGHRTLVNEIQPERLAQLRRLLRNDISLDRVWHELNERGDQPAPQVMLDAVLYQLCKDGIAALENPSCRHRLAKLSDTQLRELIAALIRARTTYPAVADDLLLILDEIRND
jgi:hypothetical protein